MKRSIFAFVVVCLTAILLFGGSWVNAADAPAKEKTGSKEPLTQFHAYLPTIRCKALLENERKSVAELERLLTLYRAYVESGLANHLQAGQVEEEVLRARLRLLQRDTDYRDSVERFTGRFKVPEKHRKEMEKLTIRPLASVFRRFEKLACDSEEIKYEAMRLGRNDDVAKVRPALVQLLTSSPLVKDMSFPKRFCKEWAEWEMIQSIEEVQKRIERIRKKELDTLRQRIDEENGKREKLSPPPAGKSNKVDGRDVPEEKQKELPRKAGQSAEDRLYFTRNIGSLEYCLRIYERQPWKSEDVSTQQMYRIRTFRRIEMSYLALCGIAYNERYYHLCRSWPARPSLRLKNVDLIPCDQDKAEQTVVSLQKTPEAQRAGKKKVRQLRMLAKSYQMEHKLFELAFMRREQLMNPQDPPDSRPGVEPKGLIGPVASRRAVKDPLDVPTMLDAYRSLSQARRRLLQTWIDYQMVRLDLYHDLGISPPDH